MDGIAVLPPVENKAGVFCILEHKRTSDVSLCEDSETDTKAVDLGNSCYTYKHFTEDIQTRGPSQVAPLYL